MRIWSEALDFSGRKVLVSGGSDGIGYGIASAFLDQGAQVSVTGTKTIDDYSNDFTGMSFHSLDVSDPAAVDALASLYTGLDVLVNSVGTVLYGGREFEREGFERVVAINLLGVMHLCAAFQESLSKSRGSIINLDSCVARVPAAANPAYSASKAGLVHLTAALAVRWGKAGIRVNGIGPGMVPTKLTKNQMNPSSEERISKVVPVGRLGSPEDIAGAALFLASPLASYVTGQSLAVDGGLTIVSAIA